MAAEAKTKLALGKQACGKTVLKPLIAFLAGSECAAQLAITLLDGWSMLVDAQGLRRHPVSVCASTSKLVFPHACICAEQGHAVAEVWSWT